MTRDDVIRIALEAGIDAESDTLCRHDGWVEPIERFAAIVAAAEREACADICDQHNSIESIAQRCAAAIRARGKA